MPERTFSEREFARYLRGNFSEDINTDSTDKSIVERWMAMHPQDRSLIREDPGAVPVAGGRDDDGGLLAGAAITAARIVPPMIGYGIGGLAGGLPGAVIGGTTMGALGSTIAQFLERSTGRREEYSPTAIGVEGIIGGIPYAPMLKGGRAARVAVEGLKGAGIGGGSAAALQWAEDKPMDVGQIATGAAFGGVLGGIGGAMMSKVAPEHVPSQHASAAYKNILNKRSQYEKGEIQKEIFSPIKEIDASTSTRDSIRARVYDYLAEGRSFLERIARHSGMDPDDVMAGAISDQQRGGVGHIYLDAEDKIQGLMGKMKIDDVYQDTLYYLDLKGFKHAGATWDAHTQKLKVRIDKVRQGGNEQLAAKLEDDMIENVLKQKAGKGLPEGYSPDLAEKEIVQLREKIFKRYDYDEAGRQWTAIQAHADEVFKFNRETLDIMRDSGFITRRFHKELATRGDNGDHIPLNRFVEAMTDQFVSTRRGGANPLFKLEGSEKTTLDPLAASLLRRRSVLLSSAHNNAKAAFIKTRNINDDFATMIPEVKTIDGKVPKPKDGWDHLKVWIDGEERTFSMPTGVVAGLESLDQAATNVLGDIGVSFLTKMTQRMATSLNLGFSFTNVLRDVTDVALLRQVVENPREFLAFSYDWASAAAQLGHRELRQMIRPMMRTKPMQSLLGGFDQAKGRQLAKGYMDLPEVKLSHATRGEFVEEGAGYSSLQRSTLDPRKGIAGEYKRGAADRLGAGVLGGVDFVLSPIGRISNVLEEATKVASFNTLTRKGITGTERAMLTRRFGGSPDFAVRGQWAKDAGNFILFFNAQMQGIVRNVRAVDRLAVNRKDWKSAKGRKAIAQLMLPITALEAIRQTWNAQFTDPDGVPSIDRITDSDHQNYFTFILPDLEVVEGTTRHKAVKFSKGHMARVLFNPMQDVLRAATSVAQEENFMGMGGFGKPTTKPFRPTQTVLDATEQFLPGSMKLETVDTGEKFLEGIVSSLAPVWKTPSELFWNKDAFSGIPLESMYQQSLDPSQRRGGLTSPALSAGAKRLAEDTGIEISPISIQKVVSNVFPGGGQQAIKAADILMEGGSVPSAVGGGIIEPIGRRFVRSKSDQYQRDLMNTFRRAQQRSRSAQATHRDLLVNSPSEARKYAQRNAHILNRRKSLDAIGRTINQYEKAGNDFNPQITKLLEAATRVLTATKPK